MSQTFCIYLPEVPGFIASHGYGRGRPTAHLHYAALFPDQVKAEKFLRSWRKTQAGEMYPNTKAMLLPVAAVLPEEGDT